MDDPTLFVKILIAMSGTLLLIVVSGIKYVMSKLKEIVPETQIKQMINERTAEHASIQSFRAEMLNKRLDRIEEQLDTLLSIQLNDRRNPPKR